MGKDRRRKEPTIDYNLQPGELNFWIDYPQEGNGHYHCYLEHDGFTLCFSPSQFAPPFHDLLDFLRSITLQRLPARFYWDEEGFGPHFEAWPINDPPDSPNFHLRVIREDYDSYHVGEGQEKRKLDYWYNMICFDADFNREAVVDVFLLALYDFALYNPSPDIWGITLPDLEAFERLRARKVPPRSDITHAEPMGLEISRYQDDDSRQSSQHLKLCMWDMQLMEWGMDDTDPFWPKWFALLEHALAGQPYEMSFDDITMKRQVRNDLADGTFKQDDVWTDWSTRMRATPLNHPHRFRLQIYETDYRHRDFLRVDEVIDPFDLTRAFLEQFEAILNSGYQAYPDEDGQVFDLRELPVSRLKALLLNEPPR